MKTTWYNIFNVLLVDEDVQKRGTVDVLYFVDMNGIPDSMLRYVRDSHHILGALPVRPCGFHVCYNNELLRPFLSFLHMVTPKDRRLRERLHFGSQLEVQYKLCTFGIDLQSSSAQDCFSEEYMEKFLEDRRQMETEEAAKEREQEAKTGIIQHPAPNDVLCGRGKPYQDFPGNIRLGSIVDEHVPRYLETRERLNKTKIATGIVNLMKESGSRFLTRRDDGWELADDKVARGKISQALRVKALKKIRGEGLEPEPISGEVSADGVAWAKAAPSPDFVHSRDALHEMMPSRDFKRLKYSSLEDDDEEVMDLIDFDGEEYAV